MPGPAVRLYLPSRNTTARSYCAAMRRLKMIRTTHKTTATIRMVVAKELTIAGLLQGKRPRLQLKWGIAGAPVLHPAHGSHVPGHIDGHRCGRAPHPNSCAPMPWTTDTEPHRRYSMAQSGDGAMSPMRSGVSALACGLLQVIVPTTTAAQQPSLSIEKLLTDGWEVAGYVSAWENRSLILFKHKEHKYLVQCSVLLDVMRNPRLVIYCYELRCLPRCDAGHGARGAARG